MAAVSVAHYPDPGRLQVEPTPRAKSLIQAQIAGLVSVRKRDLPCEDERSLPYLAFGNHAAETRRRRGRCPTTKVFSSVSDMQALARARAEAVLSHWQDLAITAARKICFARSEIDTRHAGRFPSEYKAALALPGIGSYNGCRGP